jgi:hypothetical protein
MELPTVDLYYRVKEPIPFQRRKRTGAHSGCVQHPQRATKTSSWRTSNG